MHLESVSYGDFSDKLNSEGIRAMKRRLVGFSHFVVVLWLALAVAALPVASAENPTSDPGQSTALTDFLKHNRLPLVSAQVLRSSAGERRVVLSGYTATETGKSNAEKRTRRFLKDPNIAITNHIKVRPELASMRSPSPSSPSTGTSAELPNSRGLGSIENYQNQQADAQQRYVNQQYLQYMNQQNTTSSLMNALIPMIALGLALGLSGSGVAVSPGFGYPYGAYRGPYGYPNPYRANPYGMGNP
jgi:hypothetical protein